MFKRVIEKAYPNDEGLPKMFHAPSVNRLSRKDRKEIKRILRSMKRTAVLAVLETPDTWRCDDCRTPYPYSKDEVRCCPDHKGYRCVPCAKKLHPDQEA